MKNNGYKPIIQLGQKTLGPPQGGSGVPPKPPIRIIIEGVKILSKDECREWMMENKGEAT